MYVRKCRVHAFRDSGDGWIVILYKRVVHSLWIVGELGVIKV